jgi:hypothetical protein
MDDILDSAPFQSTSSRKPTLRELADHGFEFDFGKYFTAGLQLWTKDIWNGVLYTFLLLLIYLVSFVTIIGPLFVLGPLMAGYLVAAERIAKGQPTSMSDYFGGFKYFRPLLGFTLVVLGIGILLYAIIIAMAFGMGLMGAAGGAAGSVGGMFLFGILIIGIYVLSAYLMTVWWFVLPFIVFGKLGTRDALKASAAVIKKNSWWFLLIAILSSLLQGAFMLVTYPIGSFIKYAAYTQIIGSGNKNSQVSEL